MTANRLERAALIGILAVAVTCLGPGPALAASGKRAGGPAGGPVPPLLVFRAPEGFHAHVERAEAFSLRRLRDVVRLVGLQHPGPPVVVWLLPNASPEARARPPWIAGYTAGGAGPIVLFPERAIVYPHDSLEDVLRHEVAHVLIDRAAGGRPLPRWFNEGVAMAAEAAWSLGDDTRVSWDLLWRAPVPLDTLDNLFRQGADENRRAYALSGALVHDLLARAGPDAVASVLAGVRGGRRFDRAFAGVAGESPSQAAALLWERRSPLVRWAPILTSSAVLWMGVTLLALAAIRRRRRRSAELRRRWTEEEENEGEP